jgi:hypothetical protein
MPKTIGITWIDPVHGGMGELVSSMEKLIAVIEENKIETCKLKIYSVPKGSN